MYTVADSTGSRRRRLGVRLPRSWHWWQWRLSFGARASAQLTTTTTQPPDVRQVFLADCATCHGAGGQGTISGPTLAGVGRAFIDYELSTGRMPLAEPNRVPNRHRPTYSRKVINDLVNYGAPGRW